VLAIGVAHTSASTVYSGDGCAGGAAPGVGPSRERHRSILELIDRQAVSSQQQLVDLLAARGMHVTQATPAATS
jgi:hypothetical protein